MSASLRSGSAAVIAVVFVLCCVAAARAHFNLNMNVRIIHVEHLSDGLRLYLRTPMPYLVADKIGQLEKDGLPEPAPYTTNRMEEGKLVHYVDPAHLDRDPKGLGSFAGEGYHLLVGDRRLKAEVEQVRLHRVGTQPGFATLDEARAIFAAQQIVAQDAAPLYVGDAVVDIIMRFEAGGPVYDFAISSGIDPRLPGQENTANLILDYGPDGARVFRSRGLLADPIIISRSPLAAFVTFAKEGIRHILEGLDHVLFVLCLALGASQLHALIWRVTGFTIGHSVTLTAGFLGFTPSGAWFIPAVETGIALSIIYAAAIAVMPRSDNGHSESSMFFVTIAIGLLHGLGFSFVLQKILSVSSPDIWQSLLAFNLGVELGQLSIILIAWPAFRLVERLSPTSWSLGRLCIAGLCASVALIWTGQRLFSLFETL